MTAGTAPGPIELAGSLGAWPAASDALAAWCARLALAEADTAKLLVIAEELFSNTAKYGWPPGGRGSARIALEADDGRATLTYEDDGAAFDPTAVDLPSEPAEAIEQRPEGRMGLRLIFGLAEAVRYQRVDGRNRLVVVLRRAG